VALERSDWVAFAEKRTKEIDEALAKMDEKPSDPAAKPDPNRETLNAAKRKELNTERAVYPEKLPRENLWLDRLGVAASAVLDAFPDKVFEKEGTEIVRRCLGEHLPAFRDWSSRTFGRSRKVRTLTPLVRYGSEALEEYRKGLAERARPAKELDKVNQEISELINKYLLEQQKKGDYSASMPQNVMDGLVGNRAQRRDQLESEVLKAQNAMEAAELRRLAARTAAGQVLASAGEADRGVMLDLLDKEVFTSKDFEVRSFGLRILGVVPGDRAMALLRTAAADPDARVVVPALDSLAERTEAEAVELLSAAAKDVRWQVRASAVLGLGRTGRAAAVPALIGALKDADGRTQDDIRAALLSITGKNFPPVAERWEEWWATASATFRGPKDPKPEGGETAAAETGPADAGTPEEGHRVSFYGIETRSERLLFILDFSGSMNFQGSALIKERKKIDVLREEMKKTLTGLPDGAVFNLIGFANDIRVWKKGPTVRDAKTLKEALTWVDKQPVVGSTNIYDAMETGFKMMGVGAGKDKHYQPAYDTIFFMTDGTPTSGKVTDTELILGDVRRWNEADKIRIHVIGMGGHEGAGGGPAGRGAKDIDEKFLKKMAEQNNGECVIR
jgi:hypothetical protein